ncbi:MAG: retroviral-like aspartic protease family protein [Deltaproteobacteria bacterium]
MQERAFSIEYAGLTLNPIAAIEFSEACEFKDDVPPPRIEPFTGVWDTGATHTVISSKIVNSLGLIPSGKTEAATAGGKVEDANTYIVNLYLPNKVVIQGLQVTELPISGIDALIGMDVIVRGDLALTHENGRTKLTYQMPSTHSIDFVKEIDLKNTINQNQVGRNEPCPCGSNKKFKLCHGK